MGRKKPKKDSKRARRRAFHPRLSWKDTFQGDYVLQDVHDYNFDRRQLIVYLDPMDVELSSDNEPVEPGMEYMMANEFRKNMNLAASMAMEEGAPILVDMSSMGGDHTAGMMIATTILNCPVPVTVLARRFARSMSSQVPLFADRFVLDPAAQIMIHRGEYGFGGLDQLACTEDIERRKALEQMLQIYIARLRHQGKYRRRSEESIRRMLEEKIKNKIDVWIDPHDAVEQGFADAVFDGDWANLRATKINTRWREKIRHVLGQKIEVEVRVFCERYETSTVEG